LQGLDAFKRLPGLDLLPIRFELATVQGRPGLDVSPGSSRPDASRQQLPVKGKRGLVARMFCVEVGHSMLLVEHPNHDPEESRYDRHC
jgi:hypothetical protein